MRAIIRPLSHREWTSSVHDSALVLFSGGQDSTTCLAWALERYARVETIGFDYGQRHRVELECRARIREGLGKISAGWAGRLGEDHTLALDLFKSIAARR
jgi:7-cyano-7-deazaguanine synthase